MTKDSVEDASVCHQEWTAALSYKKRVILLKLHPDAKTPFRLNTRHHIDFTDFDKGIATLREFLRWIETPAGKLAKLEEDRADAVRRQRRAPDDAQEKRVALEIEELDRQIKALEETIAHPEAVQAQTQKRIEASIERAKQPENPVSGKRTTTKFINHPPAETKPYFQDRHVETKLIGRWLKNPSLRLITVVGRGGVGKTAMTCRILDTIQKHGKMPDDGVKIDVDGIVYLSAVGWRKISVFNLYHDLLKLLPSNQEEELTALYKNPQLSTADKFQQLLSHFMSGNVLVLLDNFEDIMDGVEHTVTDKELLEALQTILTSPPHAIQVIITTRLAPHELLGTQANRQERINLGQLDEKYSILLLKEYDDAGIYGLKKCG